MQLREEKGKEAARSRTSASGEKGGSTNSQGIVLGYSFDDYDSMITIY